jgi:hypothetical protein
MATENKEQVLVAMEGEISNFEKLIKFAKESGFKTLLTAMPPRPRSGPKRNWPRSSL